MPKHPNFPFRPEHVAQEALDAAAAGASIIHVHVRNGEDGTPSQEMEDYRTVVNLIREKNTDVILNVTTGPGCMWFPKSAEEPALPDMEKTLMFTAERRIEHILDLKPDMCTLDICTMNLWGGIAMNLEMIVATPEAMIYSKNQIPRGAPFTGFGVSRRSFPMAAQSVLLGGHMRVGFEDTIYLRKGVLANNNAELVRQGVEIIEKIGGELATPGETRQMLGLAN